MNQRTITILMVMIVIGGLAWYLNSSFVSKNNSLGLTKNTNNLFNKNSNQATKPVLIYETNDNSSKNIQSIQFDTIKKIYTDLDESEKIFQVSNVISNCVLIVTRQNQTASYKLEELDLTNLKKINLISNFTKPIELYYSNTKEKIAFITFSNVEENYGYSLYISNKNGSNKKKIFSSDSSIKALSWNHDDSLIAISVSSGTQNFIKIANVNDFNILDLKSFDSKSCDALFWLNNDDILYSIADFNSNKGDIDTINIKNKESKNIFSYSGGIVNYLFSDEAFQNIGYQISQVNQNNQNLLNGQIFIYNVLSKEKKPLTKGSKILGWAKL